MHHAAILYTFIYKYIRMDAMILNLSGLQAFADDFPCDSTGQTHFPMVIVPRKVA